MLRSRKWYRLDNAAKIIPSTSRGADTRVFRLVCELKEAVDPDVLQQALDLTIPEFPHFNCYMTKGLFWYYLEDSRERALVREESLPALSPLYVRGRRNLLYRVTYYGRRIHLEMFHALSDGTGAFSFFKCLITHYLQFRYGIFSGELDPSSQAEREGDAFDRFYVRRKKKGIMETVRSAKKRAYQIKGERDENLNLHLIEGTVSVNAFLQFCREYRTTIAVMTTALMMEAVLKELRSREQTIPIVVSVPVNLRNYFPSHTTRNFFGVISVIFRHEQYDGSLESIVRVVSDSFQNQLKPEHIQKTMNTYSALEHNLAIRLVPLKLKDLGILGFHSLRAREVTTSVSNVGIVKMPEELCPYIEKFASFMSTQHMQLCISSFEDRLVFGFTSAFKRCSVLTNFFRGLTGRGLEVILATNDYDS